MYVVHIKILNDSLINLHQFCPLSSLFTGVNTDDILTQYVSSIRALKVLDPSGIILELVCEPVRKYLRLVGLLVVPFQSYTLLRVRAGHHLGPRSYCIAVKVFSAWHA